MIKNKVNFGLILVIAALIGLACSGGQNDEANKLVDEANALVESSNALVIKSNKMFVELLGPEMPEVTDIADYREKNKARFDELVSLEEQVVKARTDITTKFESASKLEVSDGFKEYLKTKAEEMKKRSEGDQIQLAIVKKFLATNDSDEWNKAIAEFNTKAKELGKEGDELQAKAEKIAKENSDTIK